MNKFPIYIPYNYSLGISSNTPMANPTIPTISLQGFEKPIPVIGMGTCSYPPADFSTTKSAILDAIKSGYRHFDTAFAYGSEKPLGEAIQEALRLGLIESRDQLFITTKLWASFAVPSKIVPACKASLQNLQLDYVDMYLIHWPLKLSEKVEKLPVDEKEFVMALDVKGVWEGMEECKKLGLAKGIGVSNFSCKKLEEVFSVAEIPPAVNQVEMNVVWKQKGLREFCMEKGVHIVAYSPLGANNTKWGDDRVLGNGVLADIAEANGKTTSQVALRWVYEQGVSLVTKSFNKERMKENLEIFDWALSEEDLEKIDEVPERKGVTFVSVFGSHDLLLELDAEV